MQQCCNNILEKELFSYTDHLFRDERFDQPYKMCSLRRTNEPVRHEKSRLLYVA